MPFQRSSLQNIISRIVSDFQTRITGATSLLRRSVLSIIARVNAGGFHLVYEYLDYMAKQIYISTADSAGLEAHSSEYGIPRKAADFAEGSGEATGTNGITIPADTQLSSTDDNVYITDADATIALGTVTLNFTAQVAGADSNDDAGITLTFLTPIAGVNTSVTVDSDGIFNGTNEETDDALRARLLARKRQPPHGGASFDYIAWILEITGNTRAWVTEEYQGIGTIGLSFVRDGDTSIIPNSTQRDATKAYIIEHEDPITGETVGAPVTATPGIFMIENTLQSIDFSVDLFENTAAVRTAVENGISDLLLRDGGGGSTIYLSNVSEAISLATGELRHRLTFPAIDIVSTISQVQVLGTITFSDY